MMRSSLCLLLACVVLSSGCGDQAAVMQQCLAATPEFATRLGSALQACGQVSGVGNRIGPMASKCPSSLSLMMTFAAEVQAALAIPNLQACVGNFMDSIMSKPVVQECSASYTEEEAQTIQGLAIGAGHIECFVAIF